MYGVSAEERTVNVLSDADTAADLGLLLVDRNGHGLNEVWFVVHPESFATPLLAEGESFIITLDKAGTYNYFCEPHKTFMTGQIIVK